MYKVPKIKIGSQTRETIREAHIGETRHVHKT